MAGDKCKGCKYDLTNKNITDKEMFDNILDNCSACKRAMLEEYQDKFQDLYTAEG